MKHFATGVYILMVCLCGGCGAGPATSASATTGTSTSHASIYAAKTAEFSGLQSGTYQVAVVGDSNTSSIPPELFPAGWVNMGIAGDLSSDVVNRWSLTLRLQPSLIVLAIGTNDINTGVSSATTIANIESCVDAAEKIGIKVFVQAIPPNRGIWSIFMPAITQLNASLKYRFAASFIELPSELYAGDGTLSEKYTDDGLHLNTAGQKIRMDTVIATLSTVNQAS